LQIVSKIDKFDVGISTKQAIDRLKNGIEPQMAGNKDESSNGNGSLTGGLAGLIYGADSIPKDWLLKIARMNDIENLIRKMTEKSTP
jgi:ADP-ribosylglycohydrolase